MQNFEVKELLAFVNERNIKDVDVKGSIRGMLFASFVKLIPSACRTISRKVLQIFHGIHMLHNFGNVIILHFLLLMVFQFCKDSCRTFPIKCQFFLRQNSPKKASGFTNSFHFGKALQRIDEVFKNVGCKDKILCLVVNRQVG
jgi:hypothetical protein